MRYLYIGFPAVIVASPADPCKALCDIKSVCTDPAAVSCSFGSCKTLFLVNPKSEKIVSHEGPARGTETKLSCQYARFIVDSVNPSRSKSLKIPRLSKPMDLLTKIKYGALTLLGGTMLYWKVSGYCGTNPDTWFCIKFEEAMKVRNLLLEAGAAPTMAAVGIYAPLATLPSIFAGIADRQNEIDSKSMILVELDSPVRFTDLAGMGGAKKELQEVVDFLSAPDKYESAGARLPKGILLVGSPGTGKTLLARAVAGESNVPFYAISGSEFAKFGDAAPARVKDLFKKARETAPCIVFIDEIDSVGRRRVSEDGITFNPVNPVLNQLLVELDGTTSNNGIVVLATTNHLELLDEALIRPGRFDRKVMIGAPDISDRVDMFMMYLANKRIDPSVNIHFLATRLAAMTPGLAGADVANICNEAGFLALRRGNDASITLADLEAAAERALEGAAVDKVFTPELSRALATRVAGQVVASRVIPGVPKAVRASLVPRTSGKNFAVYFEASKRAVTTKQDLIDRICVLLSGRAAEKVLGGGLASLGSSDEIAEATKIAQTIVNHHGMGKSVYSVHGNQTGTPAEVREILETQMARAEGIIRHNIGKVEKLITIIQNTRMVGEDAIEESME